MLNVAVIVSGGGTNLQALVDAVKAGKVKGAEITSVIADREGAYALVRARDNNIPGFIVNRRGNPDFEAQLLDILFDYKIDIIVLAGFIGVLSKKVVNCYSNRIINVHCSLIPKFCGKGFYGIKVHEAVLASGERVSGATVHYVNEGIDEGEIIIQKEVAVLPEDTPETLQQRVLRVEWEILPLALQKVIDKFQKQNSFAEEK